MLVLSYLTEWLAHSNAVFDIAWVPGEPQIVTASGDQTAMLWDVKTSEHLGTFKGHQCSLKSVAFGKQEKDGFYRQVKQITGAHNNMDRQTPSKLKKRRQTSRGIAPSVDSQQSVTVVLFRDENTLISAGAVDGVVKMWDLRKNYTVHHQDPVPLQAYPYPGTSSRKLGYSSLALDSTGSRLFANCTDENIYMFDVTGLKKAPVGVFNGHLNSSFYIKSSVSPDDQFLASGSSDHNAYIWKISDPKAPPMMLQGHCQEVTSVAWCPTDFTKIASCSDDNTVRIWRLSRRADGEKSAIGPANLTATASTSIKKWITRTPHSPSLQTPSSPNLGTPGSADQRTPSPRNVLSPIALSPMPAPPASERRVKRRLETSGGGALGCPGDCDCVMELDPSAKKRRGLRGLYCLAEEEQQKEQGPSPGHTEQEAQQHLEAGQQIPSPGHLGKENSSPGQADWLSAMGQRLKREQGSPSSLRSPSAKKQGSRTTGSPISDPKAPPMMLQGHCQEVTSVAWCPTDFTKIASCSDDNTVRIWRLSRRADGEKSAIGPVNLVGWACPKNPPQTSEPVTSLEQTPAKTPRKEASAALSPQAAACAPSTADLPLPSCTPSFLQTPGRKSHTPASRTPTTLRQTATTSTSIKKWITRTPHSPSLQTPCSPNLGTPGSAGQRTPSPRNVLSPIALSPMLAPPASERRVKRRLETSGGGALGCPGDCDCVMELDPSAKKRRGLRGLYCLAEEEQQKEQGPSPGHTEQEAQQHLEEGQQIPSPGHLGKENSSPGQADWLSAMGQRLKREQGSPSSLRSPSAKKQGSRTTGSPAPSTPGSMKKIFLYFQKKTPE
ncbi:UNVERIFIED_CONTAM: hypothetical protein FKN15_052515 [Acipenser sinensis]